MDAESLLRQLPESGDDRRLLDHEPFRTQFCIRQISPSCLQRRGQKQDDHWPNKIREESSGHPEFIDASKRWMKMALMPTCVCEKGHVPSPDDFDKCPKLWKLFVEFYWELYQMNRENATKLVTAERKLRGFISAPSFAGGKKVGEFVESGILVTCPHSVNGHPSVPSHEAKGAVQQHSLLQNLITKAGKRKRDVSTVRGTEPADRLVSKLKTPDEQTRPSHQSKKPSKKRRQKKFAFFANESGPPEASLVGVSAGDSTQPSVLSETSRRSKKQKRFGSNNIISEVAPPPLPFTGEGGFKTAAPGLPRNTKNSPAGQKRVNRERGMSKMKIFAVSEKSKEEKGKTMEVEVSTAINYHKGKAEMNIGMHLSTEVTRTSSLERDAFQVDAPQHSAKFLAQRQNPPVNGGSSQTTRNSDGSCRIEIPRNVPPNYRKKFELVSGESAATRKQYLHFSKMSSSASLQDDKGSGFQDKVRCRESRLIPMPISLKNKKNKTDSRALAIVKFSQSNQPEQNKPKPPLPQGTRPRIWAASRQAICESTTWFRAYHGGVYHSEGKAHGYLLGGFASQRDVFHHNGRLIISHGGGKSLDDSSGQSEYDYSVRALLSGYESRQPIVLLADDKYFLFPYDLGKYMYVVLGLYWIVDAWAEKDLCETGQQTRTRVKYKFAFQYCEGQGNPWWQEEGSEQISQIPMEKSNDLRTRTLTDGIAQFCGASSSENEEPIEIMSKDNYEPTSRSHCKACSRLSPRVYKEGWMCFRPDCAEFFRINSKEQFALTYDPDFLKLRPQPNFGTIDLTPNSPISYNTAPAETWYSARGWCCPDCGQLCPREKWEYWDCPDCNRIFKGDTPLPIRVHTEFWDQELSLTGSRNFKHHKIYKGSGIKVETSVWKRSDSSESGPLFRYELPEQRGQIYLIAGHPRVNNRANELFKLYQEEARDGSFLRRYPLRSTQARGRMLANYFSQNSGVPYKYVVGTNSTVPFEKAPKSVNLALQLIKDRVSLVSEDSHFNEILTAAYMIEQKMAYHSDDERGLGPVVSSLSLGSIAHMHFRLHEAPSAGSREKELTLVLRHGDVLLMSGAEIQKTYVHTVVPMNFRIAATARYIDQGSS